MKVMTRGGQGGSYFRAAAAFYHERWWHLMHDVVPTGFPFLALAPCFLPQADRDDHLLRLCQPDQRPRDDASGKLCRHCKRKQLRARGRAGDFCVIQIALSGARIIGSLAGSGTFEDLKGGR